MSITAEIEEVYTKFFKYYDMTDNILEHIAWWLRIKKMIIWWIILKILWDDGL